VMPELLTVFQRIAGDAFIDLGEAMGAWPSAIAADGSFSLAALGQHLAAQVEDVRPQWPAPLPPAPAFPVAQPAAAYSPGIRARNLGMNFPMQQPFPLSGNSGNSLPQSSYGNMLYNAADLLGLPRPAPWMVASAHNNMSNFDWNPWNGVSRYDFGTAHGTMSPNPWQLMDTFNRLAYGPPVNSRPPFGWWG
jgi:hypothetical protein